MRAFAGAIATAGTHGSANIKHAVSQPNIKIFRFDSILAYLFDVIITNPFREVE
jgi:hypothetical protein